MGLAIWMGFTMTNHQYHFHQTVTWSLQDVWSKSTWQEDYSSRSYSFWNRWSTDRKLQLVRCFLLKAVIKYNHLFWGIKWLKRKWFPFMHWSYFSPCTLHLFDKRIWNNIFSYSLSPSMSNFCFVNMRISLKLKTRWLYAYACEWCDPIWCIIYMWTLLS